MTNRLLGAATLVVALMLLVGSTTIAAPKPAPVDGRTVIARVMRATGHVAKVQVAFDAKDWNLMRFYADEYIGMMRTVTVHVKDLSARGEEAAPAYDAVQQTSLKHISTLKKLEARPSTQAAKASLVQAIDAGQKAHDAASQAIAKTLGR